MVKTNKLVNWNRDIEETKLIDLFRAEYERCNIWPDRDPILGNYEAQISSTTSAVLWYVDNMSKTIREGMLKNKYNTEAVRANAIEAICKAIKVIAICNRWLRKYPEISYDEVKK